MVAEFHTHTAITRGSPRLNLTLVPLSPPRVLPAFLSLTREQVINGGTFLS